MAEIELNFKTQKKESDNEHSFDVLLNVSPIIMVLARYSDGKIIKCNDLFISHFNLSNRLIDTISFYDSFIFNEDLKDVLNNITFDLPIRNKEVQLAKEGNDFFLASITADLVSYNSEDVLIFSIDDITEKKIIEEENSRLLEELEISKDLIEEEAAKMNMINIQVEKSEEKLMELNASKDKLFSIIGHDLKNPFFIISSYAEIINEDYDELSDEDKRGYIKIIGETSLFANKLLENLLHWARSQTGRIEYKPEIINLRKLSIESTELLKSQAMKKNIELSSTINPFIEIYADRNMFDTILRNLVSNALKFTPENGKVKVNATDNGDMIEIAVIDYGIGMSEEDVRKLFRIDVQNSEIGKSKEKGTGLGLILCKEFVERNGGTIWVESQLDKGSKFKFTLPKYET